jgi:Cys-rich four helix bundle protein (predicted Tat secretion target)
MTIQKEGVSRRELLIGVGSAAVLSSGLLHAGEHMHGDHAAHKHGDHSPKHDDLVGLVNNCLDKGQRCKFHCLVAFKEGEVGLAECAAKVNEMLAICEGFSYLVTSNSGHSKAYAQICKAVCSECEEECRKHEDKHTECKACAEACAETVKGISKAFA